MKMDNRRSRSSLAGGVATLLALSGCGAPTNPDMAAAKDMAGPGGSDMAGPPGSDMAGGGDCSSQCAVGLGNTQSTFCGTDGKTYMQCDILCDKLPKGVKAYPGACPVNGMQPPDAPPPADGIEICDYAQFNGEWVPLLCARASGGDDQTADPEFPQDPMFKLGGPPSGFNWAARPPLPSAPPAPPPDPSVGVDHRARFQPPRDQNPTNTCQTFAVAGAIEAAIAGQIGGAGEPISEMFLVTNLLNRYPQPAPKDPMGNDKYTPWDHFNVLDALMGKKGDGTMAAPVNAVTKSVADANNLAWDTSAVLKFYDGSNPTVDASKLSDKGTVSVVGTTGVKVVSFLPKGACQFSGSDWGCPDNDTFMAKVQEMVGAGLDLILGVNLTGGDWNKAVKADGIIPDYATDSAWSGHSVMLVGYKQIANKNYYIVRNSWGTVWGDGGYGYISFDTLKGKTFTAAAILVGRAGASKVQDCPMGQAPALDGTCTMVCQDGTLADSMGMCSMKMVMCPAGQVPDRAGVCVQQCTPGMGAQPYMGMDPAWKDFSRTCTVNGCIYQIPNGQDGCVTKNGDKTCTLSCPAPACRYADTGEGVACVYN